MAEDDLRVLERFLTDPEAAGLFAWQGWSDPGRLRRMWAENGLFDTEGGRLLVTCGADRVGFVSWRKILTSRTSSCWNLGIALLPEARGRGFGTRAQRLAVEYLFAHTQAARVEAVTEITNVAEQRALEKAGFTREGVLRGYAFRNGRWRDAVIYSVLRDEVHLADDATP
ncbi:alanine acetyltransferase [Streptosporangium carneum]|uniref:Alanine acetyltransferase n=1 Tax=Streptosporangium carneum TaxID=47481 RepID=A0A9W6IA47_9ACTN|nr:alanine acetyltransferase [Streptosporangium carneum]